MRSPVRDLLRSHVSEVPSYVTARSQYSGGTLLDANENALGPAALDLPAELCRYPDPTSAPLRSRLADWLGVDGDCLWIGNGSDEAIDLLIRILAEPRTPIAIVEPSYGVYAQRALAHGASVRPVSLDDRFDLDVETTVEAAQDCSLLFLCSPNNPTGNLLDRERIREVIRRTRCIVALDEAYIEFAGKSARSDSMVDLAGSDEERLAVIRTFSKAWGLAGARVGYVVASPVLVDAMNRVGLPYPLSLLSARAAVRALESQSRMEEARDLLVSERQRVADGLAGLGVRSLPSDANFLLFVVERPSDVQQRLAREHGMIIRDRSTMPGLEGGLRVSIGTPEENDRFLTALGEVLA